MAAIRAETLTIANGATTSSVYLLAQHYLAFGLVMPSSFTGTTLTFQVSADGVTFQALYSTANVQVSMTVAASRCYDLPPELASWHSFKIISGSSEGAARELVVIGKAA